MIEFEGFFFGMKYGWIIVDDSFIVLFICLNFDRSFNFFMWNFNVVESERKIDFDIVRV